jgi:hypothetical protein
VGHNGGEAVSLSYLFQDFRAVRFDDRKFQPEILLRAVFFGFFFSFEKVCGRRMSGFAKTTPLNGLLCGSSTNGQAHGHRPQTGHAEFFPEVHSRRVNPSPIPLANSTARL